MMFATTCACLALLATAADPPPFAIEVVDARTRRGVPLVELRTVHEIRLVTDSAGLAVFDEPGLEGLDVFFHVKSHGYEFPADGFGFRGKILKVERGKVTRLEIRRINVAERLYRQTGGGIYRDSVILGRAAPIPDPLLQAQVLGCDSVQTAVLGGELLWLWGDTNRPRYPLGNFHMTGATSALPAAGGLDPDRGVAFRHFAGADGFARPMARLPGDGPTWLDALTVVRDADGRERLFAAYAKIKPPLDTYERGLCEFDPWLARFDRTVALPLDAPAYPHGHPFRHTGRDGVDRFYYADAYPFVRVRATVEDLTRVDRYEAFTCLRPGSTERNAEVDRDATGRPRYAWRPGGLALTPQIQERLVESGQLPAEQGIYQLRDIETGGAVTPHKGSVYWNPRRGRWAMVVVQAMGDPSFLGEIWYAEADAPTGPWVHARRVVTHDAYSFYNPKQHPELSPFDGRYLYFEGTYTASFSGNDHPTPRYDYNQVMYRLDLTDPRLNLPVAIYPTDEPGRLAPRSGLKSADRLPVPVFFALERPGEGTIPVRLPGSGVEVHLPADGPGSPAATVPVFAVTGEGGTRSIGVEDDPRGGGWRKAGEPLGRAWPNPLRLALPRD